MASWSIPFWKHMPGNFTNQFSQIFSGKHSGVCLLPFSFFFFLPASLRTMACSLNYMHSLILQLHSFYFSTCCLQKKFISLSMLARSPGDILKIFCDCVHLYIAVH